MTDRILYAVALTSEAAQRSLLHIGRNPNIMADPHNADIWAKKESEILGVPYKVFKARITVEMLED